MKPEELEQQKVMLAEAMKESVKARIAGRIFKMKEFKEMEADPDHYEVEILRWKTALEKAIAEKESSIAKKHQFVWGPEDNKPDKNLPRDGVPTSKKEFVALLKAKRLGPKWRKEAPAENDPDAKFNDATKELSGGLYTTWDNYKKETDKIHKAVEQARYIIGSALNNEMQTPFMKGYFKDYESVIEWIDQKTKFEKKIEYMADIFKKLSDAIDETTHIDTKCMNFRMALESLYIDEEIEFPDWEHGDRQAVLLEPEAYTCSLSHIFLWCMHRKIEPTVWKKIEDEFRAEIGNENYNCVGWQKNKPRLFKIIDKHTKNGQTMKGQIKSIQQPDEDSDQEEVEVELDDGMVLRVQPKFKDNRSNNWRKNFTQKFDLKQNGSTWKKANRSHTNSGKTIQRKNPDPNGTWTCRNCLAENKPAKVKNNMKCPIHKVRPNYLKEIPLAGRTNKVEQTENNQTSPDDPGKFNSIRYNLYGDTDSSLSSNE